MLIYNDTFNVADYFEKNFLRLFQEVVQEYVNKKLWDKIRLDHSDHFDHSELDDYIIASIKEALQLGK